MVNVDIETLMDLVEAETSAYADYCEKSRNLYKGGLKGLGERKAAVRYADNYHHEAQAATQAVIDVLKMDPDQVKRMYIAGRAVNRWRQRTKWQKLIPDETKKRLELFIFGAPKPPSWLCERCAHWIAWCGKE